MRALIASAVSMAAAFAAAPAMAQYYGAPGYQDGRIVRCESSDGRIRECPTGGGRAFVERQHSRAACIEGQTWGHTRDGIWVSQGCRADFRVTSHGAGYGNPYGADRYGNQGMGVGAGHGSTVRCESKDGRVRSCAINGRGRVVLSRQISRAACVEGRSWGQDARGVWVSDGCRADFTVVRGGRHARPGGGYQEVPGYGYGGQVFRCESRDGRTRECPANTRAGVQLVRQLSNAACVQGRTWGYGNNVVWVAGGCRAEFRSY